MTLGAPTPLDRGARIRDFELISRVADRHEVTVLALVPRHERLGSLDRFAAHCARIEAMPLPGVRGAADGLARGFPAAFLPSYSRHAFRRVRALAQETRADVVQFEHSFTAPYAETLSGEHLTVLSLHNVGFVQYEQMQSAARNPLARGGYLAKRVLLRRLELAYAPRFDEIVTVSERERDALLSASPGLRVTVVENGVDTQRIRPLPPPADPYRLLFVGNLAYAPNADAVIRFCSDVLPRIREHVPDVTLEIVGPDPPGTVLRLARTGRIEVRGRVDDLEPHYRRASISLVPLRAGGGTRMKILEAMAYGRCVVSTPQGCEGLRLTNGRELLVADTPAELASCVLSLIEDDRRRDALATDARAAVERFYDWDSIAKRLLDLYGGLGPA